jgi:outer membrane protein insertion porin family
MWRRRHGDAAPPRQAARGAEEFHAAAKGMTLAVGTRVRVVASVMAVAFAAACGGASGHLAKPGTARAGAGVGTEGLCVDARGGRGDGGSGGAESVSDADALEAYEGQPIASVALVGAARIREHLAPDLVLAAGATFTRKAAGDQLRRLWRMGLLADARVEVTGATPAGVDVAIVVRERGIVAAVDIEQRGDVDDRRLRRIRSLAGAIDEPGRTDRTAQRLQAELVSLGHWHARVTTHRRETADGVRLCVAIATGPRYELAAIEFPGASAVPARELAPLLAEGDGEYNTVGGAYRADLLDADLLQIQVHYHDRGHALVTVGPPTTTVDEDRHRISLAVPVSEGPVFTISAIELAGVGGDLAAEYRALFGVKPGEVFSRTKLRAGIDRIQAAELKRGNLTIVTPVTELFEHSREIELTLELTR